MKTLELIKIRNNCCNGMCYDGYLECPFYNRMYCQIDLIKRLADRLEKEVQEDDK